VHFLYPDVFSSSDVFDSVSNTDKDRSVMQCAHSLLQPLMLRRLKVDVERTLPPKTETRLFLPLSATQRHFYKLILSNEKAKMKAGDKKSQGSSNARLQSMMMKLRKCCNHPFFCSEEEESESATLNNADPESLVASSSKMVVLDKLLAKLKPDGHKVLIFSQFTSMLDLLESYCRHREHKSLRLDGSTTAARRVYEVNLFNQPTSSHFVYLISTRAGGLGITLTAADTVILFDSDWNPTADLQAQDRAHRIGQTKPVRVYRLLTRGTVEERMLQRAEQKLFANAVVMQAPGDKPAKSGDDALGLKDL
jgi:SWI/SNF-related matrix-associated actin-dependent regulator of chromatin subfamily A member 5